MYAPAQRKNNSYSSAADSVALQRNNNSSLPTQGIRRTVQLEPSNQPIQFNKKDINELFHFFHCKYDTQDGKKPVNPIHDFEGRIDMTVGGKAGCFLEYRFTTANRTLYIKALDTTAVNETVSGAGTALMQKAESLAKGWNAQIIRLQSVPTATGFYKKIGYKQNEDQVRTFSDYYKDANTKKSLFYAQHMAEKVAPDFSKQL